MTGGALDPGPAALAALEAEVWRALRTGDRTRVEVLGCGEISTVVALGDRLACKRLPLFPDPATLAAYTDVLERYVDALRRAGVAVLPTAIRSTPAADGRLAAYCIQPRIAGPRLGPRALAGADEATGRRLIDAIVTAVEGAVGERLGLDAQLSNWVLGDDGSVGYIDVSTPMLRDASGGEALDGRVFMASLPWLLRWPVRALVLDGILDQYYDRRRVLLDLAGNLEKERLTAWLPAALERINASPSVGRPIERREVEGYYRRDARTWEILQRLRRLDRAWQRTVRRRVYPFLLPDDRPLP